MAWSLPTAAAAACLPKCLLCGAGSCHPAGLGGGMGLFLMGPLALQLQDAAESSAPVLPAMRLLTVLVPLVYRPALKVRACSPQPCEALRGKVLHCGG